MLHQKRRGSSPMFVLLSMLLLVALIGLTQLGLREVREFRQSAVAGQHFFVVGPSGRLHEIDGSFLEQGAEYRYLPHNPAVFNPPFTMTGDRRPTKFWAMGEYEEE